MTSWLDDLDAAAAHAMLGDAVAPYGGLRSVHVRPERIRALIAIVRAADAILGEDSDADVYCVPAIMATYTAARTALEAAP